MAEMFHLGFEIDTRPLRQTATEAERAAQSIAKVGDAEQKVSAASKQAAQALRETTQEVGKAAKANDDAAAAQKRLEGNMRGMSGSLRVHQAELQNILNVMRGGGGSVGGLLGSVDAASGLFGRLAASLGPAGVAVAGATVGFGALYLGIEKGLRPLAEVNDRFNTLQAQLANSLGSTYAARSAMDALYKSTQQTGLGFQSAADAFTRLARNNEAIGATRSQLLQMADTVQKLGAVSGASSGEIASGMLQFGQALASGRLQGDELRSILENFPALAKAIAESLGVSVGQLRQMGSEGQLTGKKLLEGVLSATNKANDEFARLPDSVQRSNQRIADSWSQMLDNLGRRLDASSWYQGILRFTNSVVQTAGRVIAPSNTSEQLAQAESDLVRYRNSPSRTRQEIANRVESLRAQLRREFRESENAVLQEQEGSRRATFVNAQSTAQTVDDYTTRLKKAREASNDLARAVSQMQQDIKAGRAREDEVKAFDNIKRAAEVAKAEVDALEKSQGLAKLQQTLSDTQRAMSSSGGGGGFSMMLQAIQQQREATKQLGGGAGGVDQYFNALARDAIAKADDDIRRMAQQTDATQKLTLVQSQNRDVVREVEIANEVLQKRFAMMGDRSTPEFEAFIVRYTKALRASKEAADAAASAQLQLQASVGEQGAKALLKAGTSSREQSRAQLEFDIEQNRKRFGNDADFDVYAKSRRNEASAREENALRTQTDQLARQLRLEQQLSDLVGQSTNEQTVQRAILQKKNELEAQGVTEAEKYYQEQVRITEQIARQQNATATKTQTEQLARQLQIQSKQADLLYLSTDERRVQQALMQKRNELELQGVEAGSFHYERQLQITEQLERQAIVLERNKSRVDDFVGVLTKGADGFKDVYINTWDEIFQHGAKAGATVFGQQFSALIRRLGAEMMYEMAMRPFVEMAKNAAAAMGPKIASWLGIGSSAGGGSGGGVGGSVGDFPIGGETAFAANGMAFGSGGVRMFAAGGVFTSPHLFSFANGGRIGMLGEAGPEAVMPLTRNSHGKLGVVAANDGGGLSVVINDMRNSKDAEPIEVAESRGDDGRRTLQIMVRDEVKRQVRAGELDQDFRSSFGTSRVIARK